MIDAELLKIKARSEPDLLKIPGVVGVGLRNSRRIMIYVEDAKVASSLPLKVDDVPVTVFVTGKIVTLPQLVTPFSFEALAGLRTDKWRPAIGGVSIGSLDVTAGTFGAVVKDRSTGETLILSNNHVLAQDWADNRLGVLGKPIVQPGPYDGGGPLERIGSLKRYVRVEYQDNFIDAALADLDSPDLVTAEIMGLGSLAGSSEAYPGMPVVKSGRTTGINYSQVTDVNATIVVSGDGEAVYNDQIITGFMAEGGDSGSALCTMLNDRPYIVGLLHAGSPEITVHCKWSYLPDLLNIEVGPEIIIGPPGATEIAGAMIPFALIGGVITVREAQNIPDWMK